jgi:hypothetical protein
LERGTSGAEFLIGAVLLSVAFLGSLVAVAEIFAP